MSVNTIDRRESKIRYEDGYYVIHNDAARLVRHNLGASKSMAENNMHYIKVMSYKILSDVSDLGKCIEIAYRIEPTCSLEYEERKMNQSKAIALCYDILKKYQTAMDELKVKGDKYVDEIRHLAVEIVYFSYMALYT